jgi:hypothetical protein
MKDEICVHLSDGIGSNVYQGGSFIKNSACRSVISVSPWLKKINYSA